MNSYESEMQDVERPPVRRTQVHPVHFAFVVSVLQELIECQHDSEDAQDVADALGRIMEQYKL